MIIKNKRLVLEASKELQETINGVQEKVQKKIGAIYKGSQLIWLTIYNAINSCFSSGTWYGDKPWIGTDEWANN